MFFYNIFFSIRKTIFLLCISKRNAGVIKTMKPLIIISVFIMPVIQKIIVQKRPSDQFTLITVNSQKLTDLNTLICHIHTMPVHRHRSMLNIVSCVAKVFRSNNIRSIFLQKFMKFFSLFILSSIFI